MTVWHAAAFYIIAALLAVWLVGVHRQRRGRAVAGLGIAALLCFASGWILIGDRVGGFRDFFGYGLSAYGVATALLMVTARNPVHAALWLVQVILSVAVLLVLLHAEFFAAVQIIVYAGAILILYLFTIMMVEMPEKPAPALWMPRHTLATLVGLALFGGICALLARRPLPGGTLRAGVFDPGAIPVPAAGGNTAALGRSLFTEYLFPFEVASILLLAALVGAIVLAQKERPGRKRPSGGGAEGGETAP